MEQFSIRKFPFTKHCTTYVDNILKLYARFKRIHLLYFPETYARTESMLNSVNVWHLLERAQADVSSVNSLTGR